MSGKFFYVLLPLYLLIDLEPTNLTLGIYFRSIRSVDRNKYQIHIPLPPKIDPTVTMMQVEDKPDVTYSDVGGCKEQIEKLREVVETPLLHVSKKFCSLRFETIHSTIIVFIFRLAGKIRQPWY